MFYILKQQTSCLNFAKKNCFQSMLRLMTKQTKTINRVYVSQKNKTCRTTFNNFHWTFADNDLSVQRTKFWLQGSSCFKLHAAWHSFKATLIFICQCCSWAPPPLLPHLKLPGSDRIFVLGSYMICLIVASSSYTFFFVYYCSACASHGLEQIRLSWA